MFYKEDSDYINIDLSDISLALPAVVVDAKKEYREIELGTLAPGTHSIPFPYSSDWAVAVGSFQR